jgi:ABC-type Fe3+/spermidine/putrescine transport system ATPase subunit
MRFEIRRLHEAFGITTLYVTHDQAEAMVISDRIAVLERGRVAQVGTAEDLFERPATRFVAQFIGRTNLVDGVVTEPGVVAVRGEPRSGGEPNPSMIVLAHDGLAHDGLTLRVATADAKPGASVAVSIRPHAITLIPGERARGGRADDNVLSGVLKRASYLGAGVDYEVDVSGVVLRVAAPAGTRIAPGTPVTLVLPIARCLPLPAA